jgi:hypothetical protein
MKADDSGLEFFENIGGFGTEGRASSPDWNSLRINPISFVVR